MESKQALTVAFAEDEQIVRLGIIGLLERQGDIQFTVIAANGDELLHKLRAASKVPDICMIDIQMPGKDGFILVDELKKVWPELPILVLTSFDVEHYIIKMVRKGVNGYLLKDTNPQVIKDALFTIREQGHYYSDRVNRDLFNRIKSREIKEKDFSEKDIEFLRYCCTDLNYSEIAEKMGITTRSVEGVRDKLFHKYAINSRLSLVFLSMRNNFVPIDIIFK